jgi:hexosaminidase
MTPGSNCYLDHAESKKEDSVTIGGFLPIQNVYSYEPVSAKLNTEEGHYILGAQANVWTEYMSTPAKVEYMVLPRLSAMSEVLWSPKDKKDFSNFEPRLLNEMKRYDWLQLNYNKAFINDKPAAQ